MCYRFLLLFISSVIFCYSTAVFWTAIPWLSWTKDISLQLSAACLLADGMYSIDAWWVYWNRQYFYTYLPYSWLNLWDQNAVTYSFLKQRSQIFYWLAAEHTDFPAIVDKFWQYDCWNKRHNLLFDGTKSNGWVFSIGKLGKIFAVENQLLIYRNGASLECAEQYSTINLNSWSIVYLDMSVFSWVNQVLDNAEKWMKQYNYCAVDCDFGYEAHPACMLWPYAFRLGKTAHDLVVSYELIENFTCNVVWTGTVNIWTKEIF